MTGISATGISRRRDPLKGNCRKAFLNPLLNLSSLEVQVTYELPQHLLREF